MIDENAFGVLISYFAVEDEEYGLTREEFVSRFEAFRGTVRAFLAGSPLGRGAFALDLGHAIYAEVGEGDQAGSPLGWAKRLRTALAEKGFETVAVVTHGSRWVSPGASAQSTEHLGEFALVSASNPSEPLRRALYAETASRTDEDDVDEDGELLGWGAGLYLDTEAAEALSMTPKNAPTILRSGGAEFYRAGR